MQKVELNWFNSQTDWQTDPFFSVHERPNRPASASSLCLAFWASAPWALAVSKLPSEVPRGKWAAKTGDSPWVEPKPFFSLPLGFMGLAQKYPGDCCFGSSFPFANGVGNTTLFWATAIATFWGLQKTESFLLLWEKEWQLARRGWLAGPFNLCLPYPNVLNLSQTIPPAPDPLPTCCNPLGLCSAVACGRAELGQASCYITKTRQTNTWIIDHISYSFV